MADLDKLSQLLDNIELLKKDSKNAVEQFDVLLKNSDQFESTDPKVLSEFVKKLSNALRCGITEVEVKAAETLAEFCKSEGPRSVCSTNDIIIPLIRMLNSSSLDAQIQGCRAVGNICFDNNAGRKCVFTNNGLVKIVEVLRRSSLEQGKPFLRITAAGCLLNVIMNQDHIYPQIIEMGIMEILSDMLSHDIGSQEAEDAAVHIYVILGLLTDSTTGGNLLTEKLCEVTVKILKNSKNGELSELCVELLHSQAENEEVGTSLAKSGLCELLIELIEKHGQLADDDETRNLLKMACDLIIIILNGDTSMELLYKSGKGKVFEGLLNWLSSSDDDLQVSAVLAMANFARTDKHCIQMVEVGVSKKLLLILNKHNTPSAKIRLQHALLSALRNLVIPAQNKSIVLSQGLLSALYPMFSIPTFPVVFKLLGTLRIVIDGQAAAAKELAMKSQVVDKLVEWCTTQDHPGVQGEANRLLAWIIKNSREKEVVERLVGGGVVGCLVGMVGAEHPLMVAEALLALTLVAAFRLPSVEPALLKVPLGPALFTLLQATPPSEVFHNLIQFLNQICPDSSVMRDHLCEHKVPSALTTVSKSDRLSDHREQVAKLNALLHPG